MIDVVPYAVRERTYLENFGPEHAIPSASTQASSGAAIGGYGRVYIVSGGSEPTGWVSTENLASSLLGIANAPIPLGDFFTELATSLSPAPVQWIQQNEEVAPAVSGVSEPAPSVPEKVYELRRISGLSWEQVARLLGVTRRSMHNWAIGKDITAKNEERLGRVLATLRYIDRGGASENRALVLSPTAEGVTLLDLLRDERHQEIRRILGRGIGGRKPRQGAAEMHGARSETLGEALERAGVGPEGNPPADDGIVRDSVEPKKLRVRSRSPSD